MERRRKNKHISHQQHNEMARGSEGNSPFRVRTLVARTKERKKTSSLPRRRLHFFVGALTWYGKKKKLLGKG